MRTLSFRFPLHRSVPPALRVKVRHGPATTGQHKLLVDIRMLVGVRESYRRGLPLAPFCEQLFEALKSDGAWLKKKPVRAQIRYTECHCELFQEDLRGVHICCLRASNKISLISFVFSCLGSSQRDYWGGGVLCSRASTCHVGSTYTRRPTFPSKSNKQKLLCTPKVTCSKTRTSV